MQGNQQQTQPPTGSLRRKPDRRKPPKQPPRAPSPPPPNPKHSPLADELIMEPGAKRARKPPTWLQTTFEDVPATITSREGDQQQQQQQQQQQAQPQPQPHPQTQLQTQPQTQAQSQHLQPPACRRSTRQLESPATVKHEAPSSPEEKKEGRKLGYYKGMQASGQVCAGWWPLQWERQASKSTYKFSRQASYYKGMWARPVNWRLLDARNMVVEVNYEGQRYRGMLGRTGPCPHAGIVLEDYKPSLEPFLQPHVRESREFCALCNRTLLQPVPEVEEELQRVVRVQVSTQWTAHIHLSCGLWAPEVYEDAAGNLANAAGAIRRSRSLKCVKCSQKGACIGCYQRGCNNVFHPPCAKQQGCEFIEPDFLVYCPMHATKGKRS